MFTIPSVMSAQTKVMSLPTNNYSSDAAELAAACKKNWESIIEFAKKTDAALKARQYDQIAVEEVGPKYALSTQIARDSLALKNLREPAGVDYEHRAKFCADTLSTAAARLKSDTKEGAEFAVKAEKYKATSMKKRANAVAKVNQLLQKGQISKAEKDLDEILQEVDALVIWLSPQSGQQVLGQVNGMKKQMREATADMREKAAREAFAAALNTHAPRIDALLDATTSAVASMSSSGTASIDGQSVDGPAALKALFTKWQTVHANLIRCMGISWLARGMELKTAADDHVGSKLDATTWSEANQKLNAKMLDQLPKLIAADLARTTAVDLKTKYIAYLDTIASMTNNAPAALIDACKKQLASVENGSALADDIKNYRKATDDMLLWRRRAADSAARSAKPSMELLAATESLYTTTFIPALTKGLDAVQPGLEESSLGFETHLLNVHSLTDKAAFSNYHQRVWATVLGELDVSAEVAQLERDLFVSDNDPPLSVAVANSIATAKRKNFAAVGGPIEGVMIEAMGSRFPKLSAGMNSLVPLDELPPEDVLFEHMLLRFNVTPKWVRHDHFFKKF
jgi:hypothetical protein